MEECRIGRVWDWKSVGLEVYKSERAKVCRIERVEDWKSVSLEGYMIGMCDFCEAQGKGRQRVDSGCRLSIVNCRLLIIDIDFPEALH